MFAHVDARGMNEVLTHARAAQPTPIYKTIMCGVEGGEMEGAAIKWNDQNVAAFDSNKIRTYGRKFIWLLCIFLRRGFEID